jgi:hypothetical protein
MDLNKMTTRELYPALNLLWKRNSKIRTFDMKNDKRTAAKADLVTYLTANFNMSEIVQALGDSGASPKHLLNADNANVHDHDDADADQSGGQGYSNTGDSDYPIARTDADMTQTGDSNDYNVDDGDYDKGSKQSDHKGRDGQNKNDGQSQNGTQCYTDHGTAVKNDSSDCINSNHNHDNAKPFQAPPIDMNGDVGQQLADIINDAIQNGQNKTNHECDWPEIDKRIAAGDENILSDILIEIDKLAKTQTVNKTFTFKYATLDDKPKSDVQFSGEVHADFEEALEYCEMRTPCLLYGDSGSGKSHMAEQLARAMGLKYYFTSLSGGIGENALSGYLLPSGAGGEFEWNSVPFATAYEFGGLMNLDDLGGAASDTCMFLNAAIAQGVMTIPHRLGDNVVKCHPDFVLIGTTNILDGDARYTGQEALDTSLRERFKNGIIEMDYDENLESKIVDPEVYSWGLKIRKELRNKKMKNHLVSTRLLCGYTKHKQLKGHTQAQWEKSFFTDWTEDERNKLEIDYAYDFTK